VLLVADNLQITDPAVAAALAARDPQPVRELAARCAAAGAEAIDVNSGPLTRDPQGQMTFLVEAVRSVTDLPLLIDTSNPAAMEAGLRAAGPGTIINGFSLEPAILNRILPLARTYDADIIGFLLTPRSHVPQDSAERLSLAVDLLHACQAAGIAPQRLIIDPVVVPLAWQDGHRQAREMLTLLRQLPEVLGFPVRTIAGLSNLTTGRGHRRRRLLLERTYLPMLAAAGLDMVLLNVLHGETVAVGRACRLLTSGGVFTWEAVRCW
jgi:5-methyltetrahydrofolate corrinoid/iron sulfur protein methyltransferase